ncbi:hypothetical protein MPC4_360002 [Methylocella tundrae]|uniref:Uncharacterized protein n=2 Tax=Methylocella tundrae TaxID=227605 RepID=A0A8B6M8X2_METTU|nr:hypothetical protein MPC1_10650003 [Methylocella tundrae]VTZ51334.1 hypothetical protein MPC4_360002 [Methylocella tundrae]
MTSVLSGPYKARDFPAPLMRVSGVFQKQPVLFSEAGPSPARRKACRRVWTPACSRWSI